MTPGFCPRYSLHWNIPLIDLVDNKLADALGAPTGSNGLSGSYFAISSYSPILGLISIPLSILALGLALIVRQYIDKDL